MTRSMSFFFFLVFCAASCASTDNATNTPWSQDDETAYQQCLQDNMAMSVAWEMIEQQCREQVGGEKTATLEPKTE